MAKNNKKRMSRRKRQGGGGSAAYGFGPAVSPGAPYASEVIAKSACLATPRPGELTGYTPPGMGGLPGFGGGGRRKKTNVYRKSKAAMRRLTRKMRGGRYTMDVGAAVGGPNVFVPVQRIGCEGGLVNTSPPGAAPNPVPMKQSGGVGGIDSAKYEVPTAGYGNQPSTWVSSTGTPSLLQIPYDARGGISQACLKTGGGKRSKRSTRRKRQGGGTFMKKLKKMFKF